LQVQVQRCRGADILQRFCSAADKVQRFRFRCAEILQRRCSRGAVVQRCIRGASEV